MKDIVAQEVSNWLWRLLTKRKEMEIRQEPSTESGPLYVVAVVDNPMGYESRTRIYRDFARHIEDSGAILYTVECAYEGRDFELTEAGNPQHVQLRAKTILWRKENLQNIGVGRLPSGWQQVLLSDGDFVSTRPRWAPAMIEALQQHPILQGFSTYSCLTADYTAESQNTGFAYSWNRPGSSHSIFVGAPGGSWAYTRGAWDLLGGMLETPILGSADWYMTHALVGGRDQHTDEELGKCAPAYIRSIDEWCDRAAGLKDRVGYFTNHAIHYWHGSIQNRGYNWRWKILRTHAFDPATDLVRREDGLLELAGNKPRMAQEIYDYFKSRKEDAPA